MTMPALDRLTSPSSTAGMGGGVRACARHPAYTASKFCLSCASPLCRACSGMKAHRHCPSCAVKAGDRPARLDLQWHVVLFADALRDWRPLLVKQIIPTAVALSVVTLAAMALFMSFGPGEGERYSIGEDYAMASLWLFSATALGGMLLSPGVYASRVDLRPFRSRLARGLLASLVVTAPIAAVLTVVTVLGGAFAGVIAVLVALLIPAFPPLLGAIQASAQLSQWSMGHALRNIVRFGKVPLLCSTVTLALGGTSLLSLFYPIVFVVGGAWLITPALGFLALFMILIASQLCFAYLMGAASTSLFRAVEDRVAAGA